MTIGGSYCGPGYQIMQNQINSATHTPSAYNVIGGTGGWGTGSSGCVNCYLSYQNNQSIAATPGVTYSGYETGQIICSIGGAIFATLLKARQIERARWRERGVDNLPFSSAQQTARGGGAKDVDWKRNSPRYRPFRSWYRRLCVSDDPWKLCAGHWHNSNSGMDCNEPPVLALICGLFDTRLRHRSVLANFSTSLMSPPQLPKSNLRKVCRKYKQGRGNGPFLRTGTDVLQSCPQSQNP